MRYTQAGLQLIAPMLVLGAIGYWLDRKMRTGPWLLLAGLLVGMAAGFAGFVRLVQDLPDGRKGP
jgi:F0F1-type ATP synthase assembly protein I